MRTADLANYALNRTLENRRIYAEQQVAWFYADLLKAQYQVEHGPLRFHGFHLARLGQATANLAEAHASLDALAEVAP